MLDNQQLRDWCNRLGFSEKAEQVIGQVRSSEPARRVQGRRGNVHGSFPSRKMGHTIQYESLTNELSAIYLMEYHEDELIEYWDQPPSFTLRYRSKAGVNHGHTHTPDFFVLRRDCAGWEEWKMEEELPTLAEKMPARYVHSENEGWHCPPGQEYASQFGFYYRIRTSAEIDWTLQRNLRFLDDYLRADEPQTLIDARMKQVVISILTQQPGITVADLFLRAHVAKDQIFLLLACHDVFIDLSAAPLIDAQAVHVFLDHDAAFAYSQIAANRPPSPADRTFLPKPVEGMELTWDGKRYRIVNLGNHNVSLIDEHNGCNELPLSAFEQLLNQGSITIPSQTADPLPDQSRAGEIVSRAGPSAIHEAVRRFKLIEPNLNGTSSPNQTLPVRTRQRWIRQYRMAQTTHGCGFIGLLPGTRGNKEPKIPENMRNFLQQFIADNYETLKQKGKFASYGQYLLECEHLSLQSVSYKTFALAINRRPRHEQTLKRKGPRGAYVHEPFYYELIPTVPRHGDRPFEIVHIDHTELDIELVCTHSSRNLGRPWATFLSDAFSRRLLAVLLLYDPPSYRTNMMILRECVRRHHRFPHTIVVDGGKDFHSLYFDALLATQECTKRIRPASKPRFGSVIERLFGVSNSQFVHNLQGNTQITKNIREVTKSIVPARQAIWTLPTLYERLCQWAYEIYDTGIHGTLGESPRTAFEDGLRATGDRLHRIVRYDDGFRFLTLPTTRGGTAKVIPNNGIKISNRYYWSNAFRNPEVENTSVPVRYDPYDSGRAFAFLKGVWVTCHSEHYQTFLGRTEREIMLATGELRKLHSRPDSAFKFSAKKLAAFLNSMEAQESLLIQRLRDREAKKVLAVIEGKNKEADLILPVDDSPVESDHPMQTTDVDRFIEFDEPELYTEY